jgi:hypothetical protein
MDIQPGQPPHFPLLRRRIRVGSQAGAQPGVNGQVVVAGGLSTNQKGEFFLKSAELYTP